MATLHLLIDGFSNALSPEHLLFALIGSVLGTLVGVLPGIGPTAGIAMLLPLTSLVGPTQSIIMLAAMYYGAAYGGSTTSILMNVPGETASVVTMIDGHQMAKQGRAGAALAIAAISSFVAGTVGLIGLCFFAPALAEVALKLGPPEYLGIMVLSLSMIVSLSGTSLRRGLVSAVLGMLITLVGLDPQVGINRLTFGWTPLMGGLDMISVMMGLFAMTEVFKTVAAGETAISTAPLTSLMVSWCELRQCAGSMVRAVLVGFFLGCLPGCSPSVISFIAYDLEKRVSKNRDNFGKGAIEGVAAPEGANNACCAGGFVPMLTLGIPTSTSLAVLLGGLMIYGLQPGPLLFVKQAKFVWTIIASMYIGNVILLILNLPLVGLWARLVRVPYHIIAPLILLFCFLGTYSVRSSFFDVGTCLVFGLIGLLMEKAQLPFIPMVLAIILGPMFESSLRQTISMGGGSLGILWGQPIALILIGAGITVTAFTLAARSMWLRSMVHAFDR
jgi:putative tricarboxylic transport membrane protein